ncbi:hypothetical protein PAMP_020422 [Pampus punctatissimus]
MHTHFLLTLEEEEGTGSHPTHLFPDISTNLSLPLEIQNEGSEDVYSCVAANPANPDIKWWIGVAVVAVFVAVVAAVIKYMCPENNQEAENCFKMRNMQQETASQDTRVSEDSNDTLENQDLLRNG